jgi:mRNA-degrading endonuclease toxin of MazEF toxin-antitoxin module
MTGTMADQLKSAGLTTTQPNGYDIFTIADNVIIFPEERLGQNRTKHEKRLAIILQNDKDNNDPTIKICTIAPLSTRKQFYRFDYLLKKSPDHPFLKDDSYIRIGHVQPVLKIDLKDKLGSVTKQSIRDDIQDRLFLLYDL